jgi:serine/threonine protein kinase
MSSHKVSTSPQDSVQVREQHREAAVQWLATNGDGSLHIERPVGVGGFSTCWLLRGAEMPTALKVISREGLTPSKKTCIQRELGIHSHIYHSNIVEFISWANSPKHTLIFMEYCSHGSLSQLARQGPLTEPRMRQIATQLLSALSYLHQQERILHRDIKPANVLISELTASQIVVKLADFGLSIRMRPDRVLTEHCGTPYYFSPEMVQNHSYSFPTDVWCFGLTMYFCFVGSTPFYRHRSEAAKNSADQQNERHQIFRRIVSDTIRYPVEMSMELLSFPKKILVRNQVYRADVPQLQQHVWLTK